MNDQRMLTRLMLESFKSIAHLDQELGQLTVLVGENSAGKSSLLQSIVMMSQIARSDVVGGDIPLYGTDVDIGSFKEALHSGKAADEITVGLTIRDTAPIATSISSGTEAESAAEFEWRVSLGPPVARTGGASIRRLALASSVGSNEIVASLVDPESGDPGEASRAKELRALLARSIVLARAAKDLSLELAARTAFKDSSTAIFEGAWRAQALPDSDVQLAYVEVTGGLPDLALRAQSNRKVAAEAFLALAAPDFVLERDGQVTLFEVRVPRRSDVAETLFDDALIDEFNVWMRDLDDAMRDRGFVTLPSTSFRVDPELLGDASYATVVQSLEEAPVSDVADRDQLVRTPLKVIDAADLVRDALSRRLHLLGPLRDDPSPTFRPGVVGSGITPLGKEGQYTVAFLDEHGSDQVLCPLLAGAAGSEEPTHDVRSLTSAVDYWLSQLGIAQRTRLQHVGRMLEFDIIDPQTRVPRDLTSVGVGASQILPVVVLCLAAQPGDLILLEQPELHLHPKPQQILGDFLLGIAQTGRQLVVETHSEYFVNRLRRRMVEQRLDEHPETLKLLYAIRDRGATKFEELRPNALGAFDEWPEGFFDQSPQESEQIVRAAAARRRADRAAREL